MDWEIVISYDQVTYYALNNKLNTRVVRRGYEEVFKLKDRILRVVEGSGLPYPPVYVIPEARILIHEGDVQAVVYADVNYRITKKYVYPIVEVYLPFLLYADSNLKTLVLAHEFLHYIYLAVRFVTSEYLANPLIYTGDLTGREMLEELYTVSPAKVFKNKWFLSRIEKLNEALEKSRLGYLVRKRWIERGYPSKTIFADDFRIKLPMSIWSNMYFPEEVLRKARMLGYSKVK